MTRRRRAVAVAAIALAGLAILAALVVARRRHAATPSDATPPAAMRTSGGAERDGGAASNAPNTADEADRRAAVATVVAVLNTDPPARDDAAIARRVGAIPPVGTLPRRNEGGPKAYAEGDVESFWVHDIPNNRHLRVEARLEVVAAHAYLWVQAGQPVDRAGLEAGGRAFDRDIYPKVRAVFGSEWTPGVDGDPRLHILHTEPIAGIAGFYSSADQATTAVDDNSNAREMFYVNLQTYAPGTSDYLQLLAHEFQHMIHWHQDLGEPVWVNEGLSEVAPYLAGFGRQNGAAYLADPDVPLIHWQATSGDNGPHYAASFLFFAWLRDQLGDGVLTDLVAEPANGANGVDAVLGRLPADTAMVDPPRTFDDAFLRWASIANLTGTGDVARGGYATPGIRRVAPLPLPSGGVATTVQPYGVDYWDATGLVDADGGLRLRFRGDATVPLLDDARGHVWWSNSADSMDSRLIGRFDLTEVAAADAPTLRWRSWYAFEDSWDYGYLAASTDGGATWRTVPSSATRTDDPNGNNLGDGRTGPSGGWFDESADLSAFAGGPLELAFEAVTDDAVSLEGWAIDDVALDAIGFRDDAESDGAWRAEGWLRLDPLLPQRWAVIPVVQSPATGPPTPLGPPTWFVGGGERDVVVADGGAIAPDATVTIVVTAMTPATRRAGRYRLWPAGGAAPVEGAYPGPADAGRAWDGYPAP